MKKDHYKTLEISRDVTQEEIKKAYREMSKKYHPDKNDGEDKGFAEVARAYEVLSDPKKKEKYDQTGIDNDAGDSARIRSIISDLTMSFLSHVQDVKKTSLTEFISTIMNKNIDSARKQIEVLKMDIIRACEVRDRITTDGNDTIVQVINSAIESNENELASTRNDVFIFQEVLEVVKGYSYKTDAPEKGPLIKEDSWGRTTRRTVFDV